ncbi:MAG: nucleotide exchange factor GrpE [Nitrospirae bacterium]|nr:nucleotide exchange factor GrpE [Nitrospirota bacterium]
MGEEDLIEKKEEPLEKAAEGEEKTGAETLSPGAELAELRDKYLRLYAEFENYKKRVQKDKEELLRYGNESLLYEILPVIDTLEMALKHSEDGVSEGLTEGVERTLREFQRVAEKFGLTTIPAAGRPFDPSVHHAMSQVERPDVEDKIVVEEFRKGYLFGDKVLRPSLVAVSRRPAENEKANLNTNETEEE